MADFKTAEKTDKIEPNYVMNIELPDGKVNAYRYYIPVMTAAQFAAIRVRAEKFAATHEGVNIDAACNWELTTIFKDIVSIDEPEEASPFDVAVQYLSEDDQNKVLKDIFAIATGKKSKA